MRICAILLPLREIWDHAVVSNHWETVLSNPFDYLAAKNKRRNGKKIIPARKKNAPKVLRFSEWQFVLDAMDPWFRPVAELMILTGMIQSEVAGLRRNDISDGKIHVRRSRVRGVETDRLKTESRERSLDVTAAVQARLDVLLARTTGPHVVTMKRGGPFKGDKFRERYWAPALEKAGVEHRRPYVLRHTFAAWAFTVGILPLRLVDRMGHATKQMVFEIYGDYAEGLEQDKELIEAYFGSDFR